MIVRWRYVSHGIRKYRILEREALRRHRVAILAEKGLRCEPFVVVGILMTDAMDSVDEHRILEAVTLSS